MRQKQLLKKQDIKISPAAQDQLKKKISLEIKMTGDVKRVLNKQARSAGAFFAERGFLPSRIDFEDEMAKVLFKDYLAIKKSYTGLVENEITQKQQLLSDNQEEQLNEELLTLLLLRSEAQAKEITNTTFKLYNQAIDTVFEESNQAAQTARETTTLDEAVDEAIGITGTGATSKVIGEAITADSIARNQDRAELIAVTEVTGASEEVKFVEAFLLVTALQPTKTKLVKTWETILDGRARDAHVQAHNQRRDVNQPFNVGGERLNMPGDTSLGASLANIIRCRCITTYKTVIL